MKLKNIALIEDVDFNSICGLIFELRDDKNVDLITLRNGNLLINNSVTVIKKLIDFDILKKSDDISNVSFFELSSKI